MLLGRRRVTSVAHSKRADAAGIPGIGPIELAAGQESYTRAVTAGENAIAIVLIS
jgi:hypothetical protein